MKRSSKSQASIEIMAMAALAILFFIITYLFFLNEQASVFRQSDFLQARRVVDETAALLNSGSRVEGFYAEFQVPLMLRSFTLNLTNYSVVGVLQVGGGQTQIAAPLNATLSCSPCLLGPGVYWASNSNKVLKVASK